MAPALSSADVTRYSRDGFLSPNHALTAAQAATCREQLAAFDEKKTRFRELIAQWWTLLDVETH